MTAQHVYDLICHRISTQRKAACVAAEGEHDGIAITHQPRLRAPDGCRSAIGWALADDEYHAGLEGRWLARSDLPERLRPHWELLRDLEWAHDEVLMRGGMAAWGQQLRTIERIHGLGVEMVAAQ
jgi:hypothetical protein